MLGTAVWAGAQARNGWGSGHEPEMVGAGTNESAKRAHVIPKKFRCSYRSPRELLGRRRRLRDAKKCVSFAHRALHRIVVSRSFVVAAVGSVVVVRLEQAGAAQITS